RGLLCAAAGGTARLAAGGRLVTPPRLGRIVAQRWGHAIQRGPIPLHSHGAAALRRHGAGGARAEAISGFRSIYEIGLPALRQGRRGVQNNATAASVQACFALIAAVEDTNLLHRGGCEGARYAAAAAAAFIAQGGLGAPDWR